MRDKEDLELTVELGVGHIKISESPDWDCGGEKGFSFSVSWGGGGVLPKEEAKKLAEHILKQLGDQ